MIGTLDGLILLFEQGAATKCCDGCFVWEDADDFATDGFRHLFPVFAGGGRVVQLPARGRDCAPLDCCRVCAAVNYPATIRVGQGFKFVSRDHDLLADQKGVILDFSRPGKATDNSYIVSINGKFRAESLNEH